MTRTHSGLIGSRSRRHPFGLNLFRNRNSGKRPQCTIPHHTRSKALRPRFTMVKNVEVGCLAPQRVGPPLCEALTVSYDAKGGTFHGQTCCTFAKNLRPKVRFLKLACQSIIPPNIRVAQISGTQIGRKSYNERASLEKSRIFTPLGFRSQRGSCAQAGIGEGTGIGILTFPIPLFPPHVNQEEERQSRSHRKHNILHHPGHFMHRHRHHTGEPALPPFAQRILLGPVLKHSKL